MCGRFALSTPPEVLKEIFDLFEVPESLAPRYNIAPTQPVAVIRADDRGRRRLDQLHWGLIPFWADDPAVGNRMINARAESAATKPAYRAAMKRRRCLIPADGFYEWKKQKEGGKQPYFIRARDRRPIAFAGLWERWKPKDQPDAEPVESCTILTTDADDLLKPIHDRMPVVLNPKDYKQWLDPSVEDASALEPLLRPADPDRLQAYPVSTIVNSPKNDTERCIEPVDEENDGGGTAEESQGELFE